MRTSLKYYIENKSERVKTTIFHPTQTLLMCSLHNGDIQIWNYRTKLLLTQYKNAHNGAVRGLSFHPNRPLVVSGGDDCKIRVWNYREEQKTVLTEFSGHSDYIRTTQFHQTKPWILSCSDDRTIRIWNYMSKKCIAILTGHDHYVLSARFHPNENMPFVISSSYDQSVRVWDIKDLYQNEPRGDSPVDLAGSVKFFMTPEQFAVNFACFHNEMNLIFTCGDDKTVKMWRYNDTSCWGEGVLRGHTHNVTYCTCFNNYLVSVSEDKCVNVYDIKSQKLIRSYRTDGRVWCIEKHPIEDLFAIGTDTGLKVFKLEDERPSYFISGKYVYYQNGNSIVKHDIQTKEQKLLYTTDKCSSFIAIPQAKEMMLLSYEDSHQALCQAFDRKNLVGTSVCYVGGNYYLSYEPKSNTIHKMDVIKSQSIGKIHIEKPGLKISSVHKPNMFIVFSEHQSFIYDIEGTLLFTIDVKGLKRCCVTKDMIIVYGNKHIMMIKENENHFQILTQYTENTNIKSVCVAGKGVVLYTTNCHIKYVLPSGEVGIVQGTGNEVAYLLAATSSAKTVLVINRKSEISAKNVDLSDVDFKAAVLRGDLVAIRKHLEHTVFIGDSIISFLLKYNFSELALLFVRDVHAKFSIAIQCGNFSVAFECAKQLNLPKYWRQLAQKSLENGYFKIAEFCLVQLGDFTKVMFLSMLCGNTNSMKKLATLQSSHSQKLLLTLFANDEKNQIKECFFANEKLGYIAAKKRGFDELAEKIGNEIQVSEQLKKVIEKERKPIPGCVMQKNLSVFRQWPLKEQRKTIEESLMEAKNVEKPEKKVENEEKEEKIEFEELKKEEKKVEEPKKEQKVEKKVVEEDDDDENWDFE